MLLFMQKRKKKGENLLTCYQRDEPKTAVLVVFFAFEKQENVGFFTKLLYEVNDSRRGTLLTPQRITGGYTLVLFFSFLMYDK